MKLQSTPKGAEQKEKLKAMSFYMLGLSMNVTAKIMGVFCQTIARWIKELSFIYGNLPKPDGSVKTLELDEMCTYLMLELSVKLCHRFHTNASIFELICLLR